MNSSRKGDQTEATVLARLMDLGVTVAVPFGDSDRYDLIADDGRHCHRVQCKTGSWVNGTVRFNLYTSTVGSEGRIDAEYTPEEIDAFAAYSDRTDEVYWVPVEETGAGEMRLRVDDPHPKAPTSRIRWATDYRLADRFG